MTIKLTIKFNEIVKLSGYLAMVIGLLGSGILSGCSSVSTADYVQRYSPAFEGQLLESGVPVSGYTLVLAPVESVQSNCYFEKKETTTDESGRFKLPAITAQDAGDRVLESERRWQICVKTEQGNSSIWFDSIVGILSGNRITELICDLSAPNPANGIRCKELNSEYRELLTFPK